MLTQAEVKKIIEQVNDSFVQDRKRITKLEERVAALEEAPKTAKTTKKEQANG